MELKVLSLLNLKIIISSFAKTALNDNLINFRGMINCYNAGALARR